MAIAALIVAAGRGLRLGGPVPKQYQRIGGCMILTRTIEAMLGCDLIQHVCVVIGADGRMLYDEAIADITDPRLGPPVTGGEDRADSVRNGLEALDRIAPDRVLIHDAARPFVTEANIRALCESKEAAILAERVVDALWAEDNPALAGRPVPRAGLWRAQTPQAFPYAPLLEAHRAEATSSAPAALDDAEIYRRAGHTVSLVDGEPDNFKITSSADMERAERLIGAHTMETRTGHGFDVHRFAEGNGVWLCGVFVEHTQRLDGHSDADVGLHALADAIYGALAEGDIGQHFPPSDPQWKGAESHIFLSHAAHLVRARGGRIVNVDVTLLCEAPKIAPHSIKMRNRMAELLGISRDRVSVKATTMERMGFVGREEGMGALANATVMVPEGIGE